MTADSRRAQLACGALLWLSLLLAALAYGQGLGGIFFVDDFENLQGLEAISQAPTLGSVARFVLGGFSGPLGRPLSLATFVPQHDSWPDAPGDFIYVNIALHLLNACLLFWALLRVLALTPRARDLPQAWLALGATWLWLFASLQAGAVLYVIQRMAELSGTFTLAGLTLYAIGRAREVEGRAWPAALWMGAGIATGTVLGVLAKESAALFPLLVLTLEYTLWRELPRARLFRALEGASLWLPSALLLAYLASRMPSLTGPLYDRPFTLAERLLTEPGVLFMYLQKFLLPPLYGMRLYYDDWPIAHGLSPGVLAALALWALLVAAAWRARRAAPAFSFAVAWYLAAHLLESTVIPLELAFDHRNYVALLGPALALAWGAARLSQWPRARRVRPFLIAAAAGYAAYGAFATWQVASFWGQPWELAHYWAQQQPESRRAQRGAAKFFWKADRPEEAVRIYEQALQRWPGEVSFLLGIYELGCAYPALPMPEFSRLGEVASRYDSTIPSSVGMLNVLVSGTELGLCRRYTPAELWIMVQMVFETPELASQRRNRLLLESRVAALAHDETLARVRLDEALREEPTAAALPLAIQWSLDAGDTACAARYLDRIAQLRPLERLAYREEEEDYRRQLAALPAGKGRHIECQA